jgi:hypothetical protein
MVFNLPGRFSGKYKIANNTPNQNLMMVDFEFPNNSAVYDDFRFVVGRQEIKDIKMQNGLVSTQINLPPGQSEEIFITYQTQGLDEWWYDFGSNVNQVKNFNLLMNTDFKKIDFPQNSIAATEKLETAQGWQLNWHYKNLLTGVKVGMSMPRKLNPGPWVASVSYFAPISLFLFLFMLFIFSVMKEVKIHPLIFSLYAWHILASISSWPTWWTTFPSTWPLSSVPLYPSLWWSPICVS